MKNEKSTLRVMVIALLIATVLLCAVFAVGRYGWKLSGFSVCESAGIETVDVADGQVRITGFYPGSFPQGFLGYHAVQEDQTLYVGFKFSGVFGIFETGDFDITIPTKGTVTQVIVKTSNDEYPIWPQSTSAIPDESNAAENGIYVKLERQDVYTIEWYYEDESGGVSNADGAALETGRYLYLGNDIFFTAGNLERQIPFMISVKNAAGETIVQENLVYDPSVPQLVLTVTNDGKILYNGAAAEDTATNVIPDSYNGILEQYHTALAEQWSGQQLVDTGLNFMIRDVMPENIGYAIDDLDGDGIQELAIGTISGDEFYGKLIFALYTLDDNGEAMMIFSSIERDRYYYAGGIRFANLGSSGADDSFVTTLKLEGKEMIDMTFTTDPNDYMQMKLTPIMEYSK